MRQSRGEIRRDGRLPDSALAARDREHLAQAGDLIGGRRRGRPLRGWSPTDRTAARRPIRIGNVSDVDLYRGDAVHCFDGFAGLARKGSGVVACQNERKADAACLIDGEIMHHARRQHVAAVPGIANAHEGLLDTGLEIASGQEAPSPLDKNWRAALNTLSSTSAMVPASDAPAAR